jgi:hypothetical protein
MRKCKYCGKTTNLVKDKTQPDGVRLICNGCFYIKYQKDNDKVKLYVKNYRQTSRRKELNKSYNLKYNYGINSHKYEELLIKQDYRCAVCGIHQNDLDRSLSVDHNHNTGEVRSLLCINCNMALGGLKDSPVLVQRLLDYINHWVEND